MSDRMPCDARIQRKRAPYLFWTGAPLAMTLAVLFAGCSIATSQPTVGSLIPTPTVTPIPPTATPRPAFLIRQTVTQFCQAMSDGNLNQAYSYVSDHYKQRLGGPSQLQYQLPNWGKIVGCQEFGNGDYIQGSGDHATDSVDFMMQGGPLGDGPINGTLGLLLVGSTWQVDSISM